MASYTFFDDLDTQYTQPAHRDPIWTLGLDKDPNEKQILEWLLSEVAYLNRWNSDRFQEIEKNLRLYKNIQYVQSDVNRNQAERQELRTAAMQKLSINHLGDMVKNRVARLIKYRPGVAVLPTNDEQQDKISAKLTKILIDHIWYNQNFESQVMPRIARDKSVLGESYLWIDWDPSLGDKHPDSPEAGKTITMRDENGDVIVDEQGNPIKIEDEIKVGDVAYTVVMAIDVLLQAKDNLKESEYCFRRRVMPTAEVKMLYPKATNAIRPDERAKVYNFNSGMLEQHGNMTVVWEFWHKKTRMLSKGRKIVFTKDGLLENIPHPFSHGEFPFERLVDMDFPGELHGVSFFRNVRGIQGIINNLSNMIVRNQHLVSHPKWMLPAGSARLDQLGNDITIVQYKGPQPPVLAQANPTPGEVFKFRDQMIQEMGQLSGVFQVSRGEVPPGIKAGVALQFLSEQESERHNEDILNANEFIKQVAKKTISVAGDYYDPSDERTLRAIGKNNKWMTVFFDAANLTKSYDIRVQNASALPQSKAARMQTLLDLNAQFPDKVPAEQVLDMLDLAQNEKFIDVVTVAVRAAQAENEFLGENKDVPVEEYEDHYQHWTVHAQWIQDLSFKTMTPKSVQDKAKDHLRAHEMLMIQKAAQNPDYMAKLKTLNNFPMLMPLDAAVASPEAAEPPLPEEEQAPAPAAPAGQIVPEQQLDQMPEYPSVEEQLAMTAQIPEAPEPVPPSGAV